MSALVPFAYNPQTGDYFQVDTDSVLVWVPAEHADDPGEFILNASLDSPRLVNVKHYEPEARL